MKKLRLSLVALLGLGLALTLPKCTQEYGSAKDNLGYNVWALDYIEQTLNSEGVIEDPFERESVNKMIIDIMDGVTKPSQVTNFLETYIENIEDPFKSATYRRALRILGND